MGASIRYTVDGQEYVLHSPYDCDLDKDGDTDADDAQLILSYAAGLTDSIDPIADVSGDGTVDTYDAHLLLNSLTTDLFPLPAGGSVEIGVTVTLTEEAKAAMDASTPNGAYVEGYVSVEPVTTEEGEIPDATHSVPVLGFYGDWADASMFDRQSTAATLRREHPALHRLQLHQQPHHPPPGQQPAVLEVRQSLRPGPPVYAGAHRRAEH